MMPLSSFAVQTTAGQWCSGLLPIQIEHANEMGISELQLNQHHAVSSVPTTDRSMHPG